MENTGYPQDRVHWPSVLQLGLSLVGIVACWSFALTFALGGVSQVFAPQETTQGTASFFLLSAGAMFSGLLLLPSAGYALLRIFKRTSPLVERLEAFARRFLQPAWLILLLPAVLLLGHLVSGQAQVAWFLLPVLHILAVGLPLLWLGYLGWRGLPSGSKQRTWGIFGAGLILGPGLIMILEIAVLGVIFTLGIVYIVLNPALAEELEALAFRLSFARNVPEDALRLFTPYLTHPLVLYTIFTYTAVFVPLIEEIFKPVGAWLLAGKPLAPAEGFAAGLLSGLGYALFENLAYSSMNSAGWTEVVISRIGTGLLHILTAGLTGWALALAWKEGRYVRLGIVYLAAVLLHGVWNGLALLTAAENFSPSGAIGNLDLSLVTRVAAAGLAVMAAGMFVILFISNRTLRHAQAQSLRSENVNGVNYHPDRSDLTPG
jgi:hypothetical protein